ncbi:polyprenol monophosphomannose synthase [Microbacterium arabinogalactanolyticum]|uniref:polyprenol monophosphomannose synthase n=1 Tax=Microbacterium arabinogalactanolyticum TaxID=69365 RepID=UPI00404424B6
MPHAPSSPRTIVIIPTYNEVENLPIIVEQVLNALPTTDLLVVDDSSPDGTGDLAERISASDERVHVLHRTTKDGLGRAYLAGFAWGLQRGYDLLIEMDADGSHPADRLPALVDAARVDDVRPVAAIGSRWVKGGSVVDWPRRRELLSRWANRYARLMLGLSVHDATAGFRAYPAPALRRMKLESVSSQGYCFQIDLTLRAVENGVGLREVPIRFRDRELGTSKMSGAIIVEAMAKVTLWAFTRHLPRRFGKRR